MPNIETANIGHGGPPAPRVRVNPMAPAKLRILETANRLFYADGIRSVGIDRLIKESSVTKATFYKHYGSKDRLVLAYIALRDTAARSAVTAVIDSAPSPRLALEALLALTVADVLSPSFRGSAFLNAATEYVDAAHEVRQMVSGNRAWYAQNLSDLLAQAGHPRWAAGAEELILAQDGLLAGGYTGERASATAAFVRVTESVLEQAKS